MPKEITVVAVIRAAKGQEEAVKAAMQACVAPTLMEPGSLAYVPHADMDDPGRFVFVERWTDRAALDAHMQTPHLKTLVETLGPIVEGGIEVMVLDPLSRNDRCESYYLY